MFNEKCKLQFKPDLFIWDIFLRLTYPLDKKGPNFPPSILIFIGIAHKIFIHISLACPFLCCPNNSRARLINLNFHDNPKFHT